MMNSFSASIESPCLFGELLDQIRIGFHARLAQKCLVLRLQVTNLCFQASQRSSHQLLFQLNDALVLFLSIQLISVQVLSLVVRAVGKSMWFFEFVRALSLSVAIDLVANAALGLRSAAV